jgi:hypothetical protein
MKKAEKVVAASNLNIEDMTRGLGGYEQIGSAKGIKHVPKKKKKKVSDILFFTAH